MLGFRAGVAARLRVELATPHLLQDSDLTGSLFKNHSILQCLMYSTHAHTQTDELSTLNTQIPGSDHCVQLQ